MRGTVHGAHRAVAHLTPSFPPPEYTHILASATNYGRNIVPRLAVGLDVAPLSDVTAVVDASTFERPMYAGNVVAKVRSKDAVKVMTVRATAFAKAGARAGAAAPVAAAGAGAAAGRAATYVSEERVKSERPELASASVVVSGGRALKSADNFKLIYALADKLGAAVGASRAAVDAGYVGNDAQVGQTGKVVAPALYVAVGISGAIQFVSRAARAPRARRAAPRPGPHEPFRERRAAPRPGPHEPFHDP